MGRVSQTILGVQARTSLDILPKFGVTPANGNRLEEAADVLERVTARELRPSEGDQETNRLIAAAMRAALEAVAILEARMETTTQKHHLSPELLERLVKGPLVLPLGREDDPDANFRFETYVGALMIRGGITVHGGEPDWRLPYFDNETLGVAVKRMNAPTSNSAEKLLRSAGRQIRAQGLRGFAFVNVDALTAGISANTDAGTFGGAFNARVEALHGQFEKLARFRGLLGLLFTGLVMEWVFPPSGEAQFFVAVPMQAIGFPDVEPHARFRHYFDVEVLPRVRNALSIVSGLANPDYEVYGVDPI